MPRMLLALLLVLAGGCDAPPPASQDPASRGGASEPTASEPAATSAADAGALRIVVVGDSLAAGYGLAEAQAFPALVEERLRRRGWRVEVINGGVSGDTTAGGLARLDWLLRQEPDVVVLELGGNDGLRGLPIESIDANLRQMVERSRRAGARVLLVGMRVPPNYGDVYAERFAALYPTLAAELDLPLMPFLLEGVGGHAELNLPDGIHPNAEGHARVAEALLGYIEPIVRDLAGEPAEDAA